MKFRLQPTKWPLFVLFYALIGAIQAPAAPAGALGNFGPTGVEVAIQPDRKMLVTAVQPGSPAAGLVKQGDVIERVQGALMPDDAWEQRVWLAGFITAAEADGGGIQLALRGAPEADLREVEVKIPVLGSYNEASPRECAKTRRIMRAKADHLTKLAADEAGLKRLASHHMHSATAILALLATGEEKDLDVVRGIYRHRMAGFNDKDTGPHSWNNGWQGIAVCEYYLRTGDESVMPLINAICESARRFQVHGGWTHWATGVNPQYVGGGLLNAAGTNILTTLLLARQCGAEVDDKTLHDALRFFYRFAGHGLNPYGDHRPEAGYGGNNGKSEQLAIAMHIASRSENGEVYAMARDKIALSTLHSYRSVLGGHTGPIGLMYYGTVASYPASKKPELYANWRDETRWLLELSRRHDGSFGLSNGARYDNTEFGRALMLYFAAPLRTLQITGAPKSPHARPFTLPARPWGREGDLAFLSTEGGPKYRPLAEKPHLEMAMVSKADKAQLEVLAAHPEHVFRETTAGAIRDGRHFDLIEILLESPDPLSRHTACLAINEFLPWSVSRSRGWISSRAISPENFTPRMFEALMKMVTNPDEALWLVDQSLIALALATPEQTMSKLEVLLPWLEHEEWWLRESVSIAMSPALSVAEGARRILPPTAEMLANTEHIKGRGYVEWMLVRNINQIAPEARHLVPQTLKEAYVKTPPQVTPEGDIDRIGISSVQLHNTLNWVLTAAPELAPQMAELSVTRLDDMRERERNLQIDTLIAAASKLDPAQRKAVGEVLSGHYRGAIVSENRRVLSPDFTGPATQRVGPLNKILQIDEMAGQPGGWKLLDNTAGGTQEWLHFSFQPGESPPRSEQQRYRIVSLPPELERWHEPDYDAAARGWRKITAEIGDRAPASYRNAPAWRTAGADQTGEVLFMRKTFELDKIDHAMLRLVAYTRQGFRIYLNGQLVAENKGRSRTWQPHMIYDDNRNPIRENLREGVNVLAATSFMQYFRGTEGDIEVFLEGLDRLPGLDL